MWGVGGAGGSGQLEVGGADGSQNCPIDMTTNL